MAARRLRMEGEQSRMRRKKNEKSVVRENNQQKRKTGIKQTGEPRTAMFCFALIISQNLGVCVCTNALACACVCVCECAYTAAAELLCLSV